MLVRSRPVVLRLAGLFALDSFAGGFTVQAFVAYWLSHRFDATIAQIGVVFAAVGILQTTSFLIAGRLAERFGVLPTMVFTHLPSNLLLAALAFAPTLAVAVVLLLARTLLSQMDVPTRQTYVMAVVDPEERTAAAATTNTARYIVRPVGPILAGAAAASIGVGIPFVVAGGLKSFYDLMLWRWFRHVPVRDEDGERSSACEPFMSRPPCGIATSGGSPKAARPARPTGSSPSSSSNRAHGKATPSS
jgi:predicted MFS family arabinose efflux permease